jgi:predicted DsbA family dithiol-disulfide isomerase
MKVEIWSDVACPWCYIGKRRLEAALEQFPHRDEVEVVWRSYQLDPTAPPQDSRSSNERLAQKYGVSPQQAEAMHERVTRVAATEGLDYRFDRLRPANTFDAHRLIHLAKAHGLQDAMKERLMKAYFTDGLVISDPVTLIQLGEEVGLKGDDIRAMLAGDAYADDVKADQQWAVELGITGVPFFVLASKYGVSGAQPTETFVMALEKAWQESQPLVTIQGADSADAGQCDDGACVV